VVPARDLFAEVASLDEPPLSVSACLDAAARCIGRQGLSRTSVPDVARELGVSRGTVYRQVGPMPVVVRLLLRRELGRVLAQAAIPDDTVDADGVVNLMEGVVLGVRGNAVLHRVLTEELATVGVGLLESLPGNVRVLTGFLSSVLASAMDAGRLARRDPDVVAEWLVRMCFSLALTPSPRPPRAFFAEVVLPVLRP